MIKGKFPNRGYPKIFNDKEQGIKSKRKLINSKILGEEAKKVFNEAQKMLKEITEKKMIKAKGIIAFYPANSAGDDIEV